MQMYIEKEEVGMQLHCKECGNIHEPNNCEKCGACLYGPSHFKIRNGYDKWKEKENQKEELITGVYPSSKHDPLLCPKCKHPNFFDWPMDFDEEDQDPQYGDRTFDDEFGTTGDHGGEGDNILDDPDDSK